MALTRISKEYDAILRRPLEDIDCRPSEDNMFNWQVTLTGPESTPYEGGSWLITVHFPSDYPYKPPRLQFSTKIYHPNINVNGGICLDILKERWSPVLTIGRVLNALRNLLIEPIVEDALEPAIAEQYVERHHLFTRMAAEWTRRYAQA